MPQLTQAQVNYRRGLQQQCGKCSMYEKANAKSTFGRCTAVTGQITPFGVCDIWQGLANPYGAMSVGERRRRAAHYLTSTHHLRHAR